VFVIRVRLNDTRLPDKMGLHPGTRTTTHTP
jgi:hypothetical protein